MVVSKKGTLGDVRKYLQTPNGKKLLKQLEIDPEEAIKLATGDRGGFTVEASFQRLIKPWLDGGARSLVRVTSIESGLSYAVLCGEHTHSNVHAYVIFDPDNDTEAFCDQWKNSKDPDGDRIAFLTRHEYFIMTLKQAAAQDCTYVRVGWV